MNQDEKYKAWKNRPRPTEVPPDFSGDVMRRIYRQAGQRQIVQRNWSGWFEFLPPPVRFALLAVAAVIGLSRFWLVCSIIFKPEFMILK